MLALHGMCFCDVYGTGEHRTTSVVQPRPLGSLELDNTAIDIEELCQLVTFFPSITLRFDMLLRVYKRRSGEADWQRTVMKLPTKHLIMGSVHGLDDPHFDSDSSYFKGRAVTLIADAFARRFTMPSLVYLELCDLRHLDAVYLKKLLLAAGGQLTTLVLPDMRIWDVQEEVQWDVRHHCVLCLQYC